jgi:hypothetical protein
MSRRLNYRKYTLIASQGLVMAVTVGAVARCSSTSGNVVQMSSGSNGGSGDTSSGSSASGSSSGDTSSGSSASGSSTSGDTSSGSSTSGSSTSGDTSSGSSSGTSTNEGGAPVDAGNGMAADGGCLATGSTSVHVKLAVSWVATSLLQAGSGTTDLWFKSTTTLSGTTVTSVNKACGVTLPVFTTTSVAGSKKIQLLFPNASWDNAKMPTYMVTGTQMGSGSGATQTFPASVTLLGLNPMGSTSKYAMASTTWPAPPPANMGTFPQFMASEVSDDDGDGNPGMTITPNGASPYSYPPTSIDYDHTQADKLYVVTRTTVALSGTLTSCFGGSGTATVSQFENHVVGCHDATGMSSAGKTLSGTNCSTTSGVGNGPGFLDVNRTIFTPGSATYQSAPVPADATCAVVRSAI